MAAGNKGPRCDRMMASRRNASLGRNKLPFNMSPHSVGMRPDCVLATHLILSRPFGAVYSFARLPPPAYAKSIYTSFLMVWSTEYESVLTH